MWGIFSSKRDNRIHRFVSYIDDKTKNLLEWTKYFHQKHKEHDKRLEDIEQKLTLIPTEHDIRGLVDMHYLNHDVRDRLNVLHARINQMTMEHQHMPHRVKQLHEKLRNLEQKHSLLHDKHDNLREMHKELSQKPVQNVILNEKPMEKKSHFKDKLIVNLAKNSKNYVKTSILNIIKRYGEIKGSKIKEMVVEEQKLCSKSSLYRILSEIEKEQEELTVIRQGKDKNYSIKKIFSLQ